jgi:hypothetical protein
VLGLASVGNAQWLALKWLGTNTPNDWYDPLNWVVVDIDDSVDPFIITPRLVDPGDGLPWGNQAPDIDSELLIDPPEADFGTHPIINAGDAVCAGIQTIATGNPNMEQNGGSLFVRDWVWWGDWDNSIGDWYMNGGTMRCNDEFELGWHMGGGILWQTGGSMTTGRLIIPTSSGAMGIHMFMGGDYRVTKDHKFSMSPVGLMDIYEGALLHVRDDDGSEVAVIQAYVDAGQIIANGGVYGEVAIQHFAEKGWPHTNVWATPEPSTLSLLASLLVLSGVAWLYRRR